MVAGKSSNNTTLLQVTCVSTCEDLIPMLVAAARRGGCEGGSGRRASRTHAHKFAQISSYLAYSSRGPKSRQISTKTGTETETGTETQTETESKTTSSVYIVTMAIKIKFNPTCINVALTGGGCVWVSSTPDGTMEQAKPKHELRLGYGPGPGQSH